MPGCKYTSQWQNPPGLASAEHICLSMRNLFSGCILLCCCVSSARPAAPLQVFLRDLLETDSMNVIGIRTAAADLLCMHLQVCLHAAAALSGAGSRSVLGHSWGKLVATMCKLQQSIEETSVWPPSFQGKVCLDILVCGSQVDYYMNVASARISCRACLAGGSDLTYRGPFNEQLKVSLLHLLSLAQPADGHMAWDAAHIKLMQHLVETLTVVRQ